jgi:hypothetical protein
VRCLEGVLLQLLILGDEQEEADAVEEEELAVVR